MWISCVWHSPRKARHGVLMEFTPRTLAALHLAVFVVGATAKKGQAVMIVAGVYCWQEEIALMRMTQHAGALSQGVDMILLLFDSGCIVNLW